MEVIAKAMRKKIKVIMESEKATLMENMDMVVEYKIIVFFLPKKSETIPELKAPTNKPTIYKL